MADAAERRAKYLVLFKGGASGREDAGHALTDFRQSEFRAIAAMNGVRDSHLLTFRDALVTDLAEAAGLSTRAQEDSEGDEDDDEDGGDESSLQWIEGPATDSLTFDVLRQIASRLVLTHAVYEVREEEEEEEGTDCATGESGCCASDRSPSNSHRFDRPLG